MSSKKKPTQKTPKGCEMPIPTRKQFERDLDKVIKAKPKRLTTRRGSIK